jgi:hypothetical protein
MENFPENPESVSVQLSGGYSAITVVRIAQQGEGNATISFEIPPSFKQGKGKFLIRASGQTCISPPFAIGEP